MFCKKHFVISTEGRDLPGFRRSLTLVRDDGIKHFYASFAPLREKILQNRPVQAMRNLTEVGQYKALPLLAVASGCGPSACNASLMQAYVCQSRLSIPSFSRQRTAVRKKIVLHAKSMPE